MKYIFVIAFAIVLQGCATSLTVKASQLKPIGESEKKACEFTMLVTEGAGGRGSISRNTKSAINSALNQVAESGGDSYFFVSSNATTMGSAVIVEAYRCNKTPAAH